MIKITQNEESQNFVVSVVKPTIKETWQVANRVARVLAKQGVTTVSVAKQGVVEVEFSSYNDEISADDVLWLLTDTFNVGYGYWDYLGFYIESDNDNGTIQTNKDGSCVKIMHKNSHKLRDNEEFPYTFAGGLQYFEIWRDTVRIDFPSSHNNALQVAQDLQNLLDSLN